MSNDIQKADQIAHRFYTKLCLVVSNARATSELRSQQKVDKWVRNSFLSRHTSSSLCSLTWKLQTRSSSRTIFVCTGQYLLHLRRHHSNSRCYSQSQTSPTIKSWSILHLIRLVYASTQLPNISCSRIGCSILLMTLQVLLVIVMLTTWHHLPSTSMEYRSSAVSTVSFVSCPPGSFTRNLGGAQAMYTGMVTSVFTSASRALMTALAQLTSSILVSHVTLHCLVASFHLIDSFYHFISVSCRQAPRSQRCPPTARKAPLPYYSAPHGHTHTFDRLPLLSELPA